MASKKPLLRPGYVNLTLLPQLVQLILLASIPLNGDCASNDLAKKTISKNLSV